MSVPDITLVMSATVVKAQYARGVARWEPNARGRLEEAALDLYVERGFECTTVEEIAKRAGLTERTFFRHFADKREVLFGGSEVLRDLLVGAVAEAPPESPIDAVAAALVATGPLFEQRRKLVLRRQKVIAANPELQERELIKMASLSGALADALRRRGVDEPAASLTAEAGIAAFRVAFQRWVEGPNEELADLIGESLAQLKAAVAGS
jgi:AcrR family transcriptional regulator